MKKCTCLFFETGFPVGTPGCTSSLASSSFPFWGNFFFADIIVSNFITLTANQKLYFFTDESGYSAVQETIRRWNPKNSIELQLSPQNGKDFYDWLKVSKSDRFIISGTSNAYIFSEKQLAGVLDKPPADIAKVSIEMAPLDLYIVTKRKLLAIARDLNPDEDSGIAFQKILLEKLNTDFDIIEDIPGKILFHKRTIDLFSAHMFLLELVGNEEYGQIAERFSFLSHPHSETYIGETGIVENSFIAAGAEIHGSVIHSVIFPGVSIAQGARIENSVIMSNNKIGQNSKIENSLIFPYMKTSVRESYNISTDTHIGSLSRKSTNTKYPEHIRDGISLIGLNPEIPRGTVIDSACYIAPNLSIDAFSRYNKVIKKGMCIET